MIEEVHSHDCHRGNENHRKEVHGRRCLLCGGGLLHIDYGAVKEEPDSKGSCGKRSETWLRIVHGGGVRTLQFATNLHLNTLPRAY